MSKLIEERPSWQLERGPRYGNQRKSIVKSKVRKRRRRRAQENQEDYLLMGL